LTALRGPAVPAPVIVLSGHILKDVAQVEAVDGGHSLLFQERFQRQAVPFQAIQIGANGLEVFWTQGQKEALVCRPSDPLQDRVIAGLRAVRRTRAGRIRSATLLPHNGRSWVAPLNLPMTNREKNTRKSKRQRQVVPLRS